MSKELTILLCVGMVGLVLVARLCGFGSNSVIDDQREVALRHKAWRGDFGLEARQRENAAIRGNWIGQLVFGGVLAACAVAAVVWSAIR